MQSEQAGLDRQVRRPSPESQQVVECRPNLTESIVQGVNPWIEVDGGVSPANAYQLIEVGANALVAGSAVFGAKDYAEG